MCLEPGHDLYFGPPTNQNTAKLPIKTGVNWVPGGYRSCFITGDPTGTWEVNIPRIGSGVVLTHSHFFLPWMVWECGCKGSFFLLLRPLMSPPIHFHPGLHCQVHLLFVAFKIGAATAKPASRGRRGRESGRGSGAEVVAVSTVDRAWSRNRKAGVTGAEVFRLPHSAWTRSMEVNPVEIWIGSGSPDPSHPVRTPRHLLTQKECQIVVKKPWFGPPPTCLVFGKWF